MSAYRNVLYLCGGPQSGGSTLVSWCFLQRRDMNGVLDAASDLLPFIDPGIGAPLVWYKSTTVCFRLSELADHYRDQGWEVRPLLVVRDLRKVWASLLTKPYACNGITAEDPPLRMRIRRFVDDWRQFRQMDWPILRYEDLLEEPRAALEETCVRLGLPWDEAMLTWPKSPADIVDCRWGNESFWKTRGDGLAATLASYAERPRADRAGRSDLEWLEGEFRDFNVANNYPAGNLVEAADELPPVLSFEVTRRYKWETAHKPVRWLLSKFGVENRPLVQRRSRVKAA